MNKLIDIHNHCLPKVDDGAKTIDEAIESIKNLFNLGFTDIVLTSHYIINTNFNKNVADREKIFNKLKEKLNDIPINLYLGNEVFITDAKTLLNSLKIKEITTLNNSKYLLIELPMHQFIQQLDSIICTLNDAGIIPIIAHPERYSYYWDNPSKLKSLLEYNCYLQCNIDSINGLYGNRAKKMIKYLLKENMVCTLATDTHYYRKQQIDKSLRKLEKLIGKEKLVQLTQTNPYIIINDLELT